MIFFNTLLVFLCFFYVIKALRSNIHDRLKTSFLALSFATFIYSFINYINCINLEKGEEFFINPGYINGLFIPFILFILVVSQFKLLSIKSNYLKYRICTIFLSNLYVVFVGYIFYFLRSKGYSSFNVYFLRIENIFLIIGLIFSLISIKNYFNEYKNKVYYLKYFLLNSGLISYFIIYNYLRENNILKLNLDSYNIFLLLIPLIVINVIDNKYNILSKINEELLRDSLILSGEGIGIIKGNKLIYSNHIFDELFSLDYDTKQLDPTEFLPDEIILGDLCKKKRTIIFLKNSDKKVEVEYTKEFYNRGNCYIITVFNIEKFKIFLNKELSYIEENAYNIINEKIKKLNVLNSRLKAEIKDLVSKEQELILASSTDKVTGLRNRRYFLQMANEILSKSDEKKNNHLLIYIDLDNFKNINDVFNHDVGDEVLKKYSQKLKEFFNSRKFTSGEIIISRVGGDEFMVFVEDYIEKKSDKLSKNVIRYISKNINKIGKESFLVGKFKINTSSSIGISIYPESGKDLLTLIKNADIAMYNAKNKGKNSFEIYKAEKIGSRKRKFNLINDMVYAIEKNEFVVSYEETVFKGEGSTDVIGFDTKIVWMHSKEGKIAAKNFIPFAENSGYIEEIFAWLFKEVVEQIKKWSEEGKNYSVSINFFTPKFDESHLNFLLEEAIEKREINPRNILIKVPEEYIKKDPERMIDNLNFIRNLGFRIIIDGFGTKYSSLSYLKHIPCDYIKIDKNFIWGIGKNKKDEAIIMALIQLCKNSNIGIIAQDIVAENQMKFLSDNGLFVMQGPYFSKK